MQTEIRVALTRKQSQFDRLIKSTENVLFGGAKGGGKSAGLRLIMLKRRIEIAGSYGVIFRKTYPELYNNHIRPILKKYPALSDRYDRKHKEIHFENGSILAFRHCHYASDLEDHQGQEYHDLAIEEAGEWPEDWFWTLKGSNRSATAGIKPRCLLTGNPGGVGHKWLKRLFITKNFRENEVPMDYDFVPARVFDNPFIMRNDPGYIARLKANKNPMLVKAYLEGSWDIMAGQFFENVSRETHLIEPFAIPDHWQRMGMFDTGYSHPAGFLWMAMDNDGNCYVYREFCQAKLRTEEIVKHHIIIHDDSFKLNPIVSGWDSWTKKGGGPSVQEKFYEASGQRLSLTRENGDRVAGAMQVRDYLALQDDGRPKLYIFKTCPMTFDCLTRMTHDLKNPEDVLKVDSLDGDPMAGDELYDCLRMGLMNRPRMSSEPETPKKRTYYDDDERPVTGWTAV